jgi:predicted lipoprotein with Yx(FWY)xxD motif
MKNGTASAGARVARSSRTRARRPRVYALVALGAAGAIALAACGGSGSSNSSKKTTTTKKGSGAAAAAAVVKTANAGMLGTIVVTNDGKTVYTLTNAGQQVPCTGACLQVWMPVMATGGGNVTGTGVKNVAKTASGQVTISGAPVYTFVPDANPGDTKGEGIMSFGGTWHVVTASGTSGGASGGGGTATTTPASTSKSGSGY